MNTILIYDQIGLGKIDGAEIANRIYALAESHDEINIRINSLGGSVINGLSIVAAIADVKAKVIAHIDGVAASMASVIAVSADEVVMKDYGLLMIHNPHFGKKETTEKEQATIEAFAGALSTIYAKRTKLDEKELRAKMEAETWFNATQALESGLVDRIQDTGRTFTKDADKIAATVSQELLASADATLLASTKTTTNTKQENQMNEELLKAYGLDVKASSEDVLKAYGAKLEELNAKVQEVTNLKAEVETLKADVEAKENEIARNKAQRADELVEKAVAEGRIKAGDSEDWKEIALANYEKASKMINGLEASVKLSEITEGAEEKEDKEVVAGSPIEQLMAKVRGEE